MKKSDEEEQLDLLHQLTKQLHIHSLQITTAESCTGGLIASRLTHLPNSSAWFDRAFITYSNVAKEEMLNVPSELIKLHGAVSAPVAKAMALGALENSPANLAISVTGIAGPSGGTPKKPVGTVYFGWAMRDHPVITLCKHFEGSREKIRFLTCFTALKMALQLLEIFFQTGRWGDLPRTLDVRL